MTRLLLPFFFFLTCSVSRSQDHTCCKPDQQNILEKELLSLKQKLNARTERTENGLYRIRYKEITGMIQGFPRGPWLADSCLQKYNSADPVSIKKIKSKIEDEFLPTGTKLCLEFYEHYLVVSFYKRIEGAKPP